MKNASLVPLAPEDFVSEMATVLRVAGMTFDGSVSDVEDRAYNILWQNPGARGGYSHAEIQPRLTAVLEEARRLGPIDLNMETA